MCTYLRRVLWLGLVSSAINKVAIYSVCLTSLHLGTLCYSSAGCYALLTNVHTIPQALKMAISHVCLYFHVQIMSHRCLLIEESVSPSLSIVKSS